MSNPIKDIENSERINERFAEIMYQKMASARYGISFCCTQESVPAELDKELLDLNNIMDKNLTTIV